MVKFFSWKFSYKRVIKLFGIMMIGSVMTLASLSYLAHKYPLRTPTDSIAKFQEVLETIIENNVNEDAVADMDTLIEVAIKAIFEHIGDKYGGYYNEKATKQLKDLENPKGYSGIGSAIQLFKEGEEVKGVQIIEIFDGSLLDEAGLKPGDVITHVNGERYETVNEYATHLKGKKGTTVKVTVLRGGLELGEFIIKRVKSKVQTVYSKEYECFLILRVTQFAKDTSDAIDLNTARQVKAECNNEFRGIILDLRNNPGGLLTSALDVTEKWTDPGTLMVRIKPKKGHEDTFPGDFEDLLVCNEGDGEGICYYSTDAKLFQGEPLVILVNGKSASASEIVTGSVSTNYKETTWVMGSKTFGKGSVQSFFTLSDGTQLKTTTARYYPAGDVVIDGVGIEPELAMDAPVIEGDNEGMQKVNYHFIRAMMDPEHDLELAEAIRFLEMLEEDGHSLNWEPVNADGNYKCYLNKPCEKLPSLN